MHVAYFSEFRRATSAVARYRKLARGVIRIHPVLRLRDARFIRRLRRTVSEDSKAPDKVALNRQLDQLSRELVRNPQN